MPRRTALGVLGMLAALMLAAAGGPAGAAAPDQTAVPAVADVGTVPAFTPVTGTGAGPVMVHSDDMCPPSAIAYPRAL